MYQETDVLLDHLSTALNVGYVLRVHTNQSRPSRESERHARCVPLEDTAHIRVSHLMVAPAGLATTAPMAALPQLVSPVHLTSTVKVLWVPRQLVQLIAHLVLGLKNVCQHKVSNIFICT